MAEEERNDTNDQSRQREDDRCSLPDTIALDRSLEARHLVITTMSGFELPLLDDAFRCVWHDLPKRFERAGVRQRPLPALMHFYGLRNPLFGSRLGA